MARLSCFQENDRHLLQLRRLKTTFHIVEKIRPLSLVPNFTHRPQVLKITLLVIKFVKNDTDGSFTVKVNSIR